MPSSRVFLAHPIPPVTKQYTGSFGGQACYDGNGYTLSDITACSQGTSDANRLGDTFIIDSAMVRYGLVNNTGASACPFVTWRILVFQYLGDSSVSGVPSIANLLLASSANSGTTQGTHSFFNRDYARQYIVLADSGPIVTTGSAATAVNGSAGGEGVAKAGVLKVNLSRADRFIGCYAGANTGPNHIFLMVTTDQASVSSNPTVNLGYVIRFRDFLR